jgi:hypothetical protein
MEVIEAELTSTEIIQNALASAGISLGDRVLMVIGEHHVHITKNPVDALWGSLKSRKNALELKTEAIEAIGELIDEKSS